MKWQADKGKSVYIPAIVLNRRDLLEAALKRVNDVLPIFVVIPVSGQGPAVEAGPIVPAYRLSYDGIDVSTYQIVNKVQPVEALNIMDDLTQKAPERFSEFWPLGYLVPFTKQEAAKKFRDEIRQMYGVTVDVPVVEVRFYRSAKSELYTYLMYSYCSPARNN